jgi:hypothetical protein
VLDSELQLWRSSSPGTGATFDLHELTRSFAEGQVTWNNATSTIPWTTKGGDFIASPVVSLTSTGQPSRVTWKSSTFTTTVQKWANAFGDNHGQVTRFWVHSDTLLDLEIEGGVLATTEDHPFWNATDREFQRADQLDPGDELLTPSGELVRVIGIRPGSHRVAAAYNLTVDGIHTYYVVAGQRPVLVHNTCGDHIALGLTENVRSFAESVGARHVMGQAPGEWQQSVMQAAYDSKSSFSVSLDGVEGTSDAISRGKYREMGLEATIGGRTSSWFDWEMYILDEANAWGRVTFYKNGDVVSNPFGR